MSSENIRRKTMEIAVKILDDPNAPNLAAAAHDVGPINTLKIIGAAVYAGSRLIDDAKKSLLIQHSEEIAFFSGYIIGESGVGSVTELSNADKKHIQLDSNIRRSAGKLERSDGKHGIPRLNPTNRFKTAIYDMVGIGGETAPFALLYEVTSSNVPTGTTYMAFGLSEGIINGVPQSYIVPPTSDNIQFFLKLEQYDYPESNQIIFGVPNLNDPEKQTPVFIINTKTTTDSAGNSITNLIDTSFIPPFANSSIGPVETTKNVFTHARVKRALPAEPEAPQETQLPDSMTDKYLRDFVSVETGVKLVNGKNVNVFNGVKEDGTKQVIAMEIEIDGEMRMTRVGEHTDGKGFSFYTYIDPEFSSEGRFNVTGDTSRILFGEPEGPKDVNMWNSLAKQLGFATAEEARDFVMVKNGGKLKFKVPYGPQTNGSPTIMKELPYEANFNLPIQIVTILTESEYNNLPESIRNNMSYSAEIAESVKKSGESYIFQSLLQTDKNGQLTIYSVETSLEAYNRLDPNKMDEGEKKYINEDLRKLIGSSILDIIQLTSGEKKSISSYKRQLQFLLETDGLTFKGSSQ